MADKQKNGKEGFYLSTNKNKTQLELDPISRQSNGKKKFEKGW